MNSSGCPGPSRSSAAAAQAIGVDRLTVIIALDPVAVPHGQWDDGGNALSLDRGLPVLTSGTGKPTTG